MAKRNAKADMLEKRALKAWKRAQAHDARAQKEREYANKLEKQAHERRKKR